jgi:hypothetical protein
MNATASKLVGQKGHLVLTSKELFGVPIGLNPQYQVNHLVRHISVLFLYTICVCIQNPYIFRILWTHVP